ncbi:MAG TPA: hypothetical protein VFK38_09865 [Candidatus Limnocylindrales bacterium]|nr:hypothetical protein [Candidatus Limnocylindrales bacterium]
MRVIAIAAAILAACQLAVPRPDRASPGVSVTANTVTVSSNPCTDHANAPYGRRTLTWPPPVHPACLQAMALIPDVLARTSVAGHHLEFGTAQPFEDTKQGICPSRGDAQPCWQVDFYDYELHRGYRVGIRLAPPEMLALYLFPGIQPSKAEADRVLVVGMADTQVSAAYDAASGWLHWLFETVSGEEGTRCRVDRCISARTWDADNRLIHFTVDLHTGEVIERTLP